LLMPLHLPLSQPHGQPIPCPLSMPVRKRTRSMRGSLPALDLDVGLCSDPDLPVTPPPSLSSAYQRSPMSLSVSPPASRSAFNPQTKIEIFDVSYDDDFEPHHLTHHDHVPMNPHYPPAQNEAGLLGMTQEEEEEFTLAMDLSPPRPQHMSLPLPVSAYPGFSKTTFGFGHRGRKSLDREEWMGSLTGVPS